LYLESLLIVNRLPQNFSEPIRVDLQISQAGAFEYWIEHDGPQNERIRGKSGYFNVDPILKIKARTSVLGSDLTVLPPDKGALLKDNYVNLPLDGLNVLTVVSKWMGPLPDWRLHFQEAKDRGYTMLHYPPLEERGESDSPYSIRNQFKYDPSLFGGIDVGEEEGMKKVTEILRVAREEYGLLALTDVVLNHTANDSPWLLEHPEAGNPLSCRIDLLIYNVFYRLQSCQYASPYSRMRARLCHPRILRNAKVQWAAEHTNHRKGS
jgi:glycogen debranching enzyme